MLMLSAESTPKILQICVIQWGEAMNGTRENQFAELLTEAIHTIKRRTGRPISVIQDELTFAIGREEGNPLEYWRKGHIPTKQSEFVQLTQELVQRGNLNREWLKRFWDCTEFVGFSDIEAELFAGQRIEDWLPQKPYGEFIGRQELVNNIVNCLNDVVRNPVVAIDGMGGIGKTALAYAVVSQCLAQKSFDAVAWIAEDLTQEDGQSQRGLTYDAILGSIGVQLGNREIAKYKLAQKEERIRATLSTHRILIILDNLERAAEPQADIVYKLRAILGSKSKALLMSRQRFLKDVYHVHLLGLAQDHAIHFLYEEAKERGIKRLYNTQPERLHQIAQHTGGSPLALKLVVGQLGYQEIQVVLTRLQQVQLLNKERDDEYAHLYKFIFLPSWELSSIDGQKLLVSMSHFIPGRGGTFEAIKATCGLTNETLASCVDELWELAFLEIGDSSLNQTRYYLHALTQHFVLSDIVQTLK